MLSAGGNQKDQVSRARTTERFVMPHDKRCGGRDMLGFDLQGWATSSKIRVCSIFFFYLSERRSAFLLLLLLSTVLARCLGHAVEAPQGSVSIFTKWREIVVPILWGHVKMMYMKTILKKKTLQFLFIFVHKLDTVWWTLIKNVVNLLFHFQVDN